MLNTEGLSPVRKWMLRQIESILPSESSEVCSNTNGGVFQDWTGMSQSSLESTWINEDMKRLINSIAATNGGAPNQNLIKYKAGGKAALDKAMYFVEQRRKAFEDAAAVTTGGGPFNYNSLKQVVGVTTCCNAFLGVLVRKTLAAGGLPGRTFESFNLPKAGGKAWHLYPSDNIAPKPGDFYELGKRTHTVKGDVFTFQHVGIILSVNGENWETADGGQGGPGAGYDKIARKRRTNADGVLGFVNADEFFAGWKNAEFPDERTAAGGI